MRTNKVFFIPYSVQEAALGYLVKDASAAEIASAVRAVANGEAVCPQQLCTSLLRYVARQRKQLPASMSR